MLIRHRLSPRVYLRRVWTSCDPVLSRGSDRARGYQLRAPSLPVALPHQGRAPHRCPSREWAHELPCSAGHACYVRGFSGAVLYRAASGCDTSRCGLPCSQGTGMRFDGCAAWRWLERARDVPGAYQDSRPTPTVQGPPVSASLAAARPLPPQGRTPFAASVATLEGNAARVPETRSVTS